MEIQKERFEAWLFSQPDSRPFHWSDGCDCIMGHFLRENVSKECIVGAHIWSLSTGHYLASVIQELPKWFCEFQKDAVLIRNPSGSNMGNAKKRWIQLFGDPLAETKEKPVRVQVLATA